MELDLLLSLTPSSCTSSMEEADIRCAVNKGDFVGTSSALACRLNASCSGSRIGVPSMGDFELIPFGVSGVEAIEDVRRSSWEEFGIKWLECGLDVESGASSNVSCSEVNPCNVRWLTQAQSLTPSRSELSALEALLGSSAIGKTLGCCIEG